MNAPAQYLALKRKIVMIMAAVAIIPLIIQAVINYVEFWDTFIEEAQTPFRSMVAKTKNSFELFLAERTSTVSLIASVYTYDELKDEKNLQRIFSSMQKEFTGFVDLSLVNENGILVSYAGPHKELRGVNYSQQEWFHRAQSAYRYTSEVFKGFRNSPHVIIATRHTNEQGHSWTVRATLDTTQFSKIISSMGLKTGSDAFLVNREGILQTDSAYYGKALEKVPFSLPVAGSDAIVTKAKDTAGKSILISYCSVADSEFVLMAVMPTANILGPWFVMKTDRILIFCFSALVIYFVAAHIVGQFIERLRISDTEREAALLQMEHSQKLSSLGRLAAGISHEINNPLAIINEKAGLLLDIIDIEKNIPQKQLFQSQLKAITDAVARCRDITQRMLGFAKRMDVKIECLDILTVLNDTLMFLEKEAQLRMIKIVRQYNKPLPLIPCDRGQMQQVFLNVLNNALQAVKNGGTITITALARDNGTVAIAFADDGCGMSEQTKRHIFEPFYTTKEEKGTGLGMAIIYGIVTRHGGDIEVESTLDVGSTITIVLPVNPSAAEGAKES